MRCWPKALPLGGSTQQVEVMCPGDILVIDKVLFLGLVEDSELHEDKKEHQGHGRYTQHFASLQARAVHLFKGTLFELLIYFVNSSPLIAAEDVLRQVHAWQAVKSNQHCAH